MAGVKDGHAVVVGASIAGLLAARALSETYARVTVLDRDELPDTPAPRRGVPQGRQLHLLLARGGDVLEELYPGFGADLSAAGAHRSDWQRDVRTYLDGHAIRAADSGILVWGVSRPTLEHLIRTRTSKLPNVRILQREATGLLADAVEVRGVLTADGDLPADLVVDAAGRGSRARMWLAEHGVPEPEVCRVRSDVVYVSREYRREAGQLDGLSGIGVVPFPGCPRGAGVVRVEGNRWSVVLYGRAGAEPPTDEQGFLAYATSLPVPDVAHFLNEAEAMSAAVKMRYPASERWRFERQRRHLDGYLVIGDAFCSFNPTYGQGMTVAAMEALVLRDLTAGRPSGLPARFYRAAAKVVDGAWALAVGGDLAFPRSPVTAVWPTGCSAGTWTATGRRPGPIQCSPVPS